MKGRESGMPDEAYWESFYDAECIISRLRCAPYGTESIAEFGCGYGTFTLPVAHMTSGNVYTFDIEPDMIKRVEEKALTRHLTNIYAEQRDFLENGTGLNSQSIDHVMIYNLLHIEESAQLIAEAKRLLKTSGHLSIIHWNYDPETPRGPPMDIRPDPEILKKQITSAGFNLVGEPDISDCAPHHYGMLLSVN